jgi:hypothetical protein
MRAVKIDRSHLTLVFKITEHEKFKAFHNKVFPSTNEDTEKLSVEIGAKAVASSWSDMYKDNDKLERLYSAALDLLSPENRSVLDIMEEKNCSYEKAQRLYQDEEN